MKEKVIHIHRVLKRSRGDRLSFTALVTVGDGAGAVGVGTGEATAVATAVHRALESARRAMVHIVVSNGTIDHEIEGEHKAARVRLRPAQHGTGISGGGSVRAVLECAGIRNVAVNSLGSNNPFNLAYATVNALQSLGTLEKVPLERAEAEVARHSGRDQATSYGYGAGDPQSSGRDSAVRRRTRGSGRQSTASPQFPSGQDPFESVEHSVSAREPSESHAAEGVDSEPRRRSGPIYPEGRNTPRRISDSPTSVPGDEPLGSEETRYLQARIQPRAHPGEWVPVPVRIATNAGRETAAALPPIDIPPEGIDLELAVRSETVESRPDNRVLRILPGRDSEWVIFEVRGSTVQVHALQVIAFRGGAFLGVLQLELTVDPADVAGPEGGEDTSSAAIRMRDPDDGEVTLEIRFDRENQRYRYQLRSAAFGTTDEIVSASLLRTPEQAVEDFVTSLNAQARGLTKYSAEETRMWLRGKGNDLWRELIPQELNRLFWLHRERMKRMTILSPGDPIPWEAMYPIGPDNEENGFLAEQITVTRWVYGPPPARHVRIADPYFVVPDGSPSTAAAEVEAISRTFRGQVIRELMPLLTLLKDASFGLLHFACHNRFYPDSPSASYIEMDGEKHFDLSFLGGYSGRFRPNSPLVFMNACRSAARGPNYTRMDGWARRFLDAGAGAFVGSLWEVRDATASRFATAFYQALKDGLALGDAMAAGREAVQHEPADPTWLAYTLYGDPTATVIGA